MSKISVFTGEGHGKTPAAIGEAIMRVEQGAKVVMIQYLKGKGLGSSEYLNRFEPEIKVFRFEKSDRLFNELTEKEKQEEVINIKNGINFARKVICTGECDLLILDELLGIIDNDIVSVDEVISILDSRPDNMDIILTGRKIDDKILAMADAVTKLDCVK